MRESMNAYLVFGHLPRKVEEIHKEQRESSKLQVIKQDTYSICWIDYPERPYLAATFLFKEERKLITPTFKKHLNETDDRMDSVQTEELKCPKI